LRAYLDNAGRPYSLNHRLVRGLDYYTKTVFEVWAQGIGAQNAVCGGGRYDGLAEAIGGPPVPAVGFASGMERIVLTLQAQEGQKSLKTAPHIFLINQGENTREKTVALLDQLRHAGIEALMGFGNRSFKAQMREANRREAVFVAILGEDEMADKTITLKSMAEGTQERIAWSGLVEYIKQSKASR
jgi:histidyl-tRNA synthetase